MKNTPVARSPEWSPKLKALSQAIAVATAGLQGAAWASCPGSQTSATTTPCVLATGEAVTITSDGSIIVAADSAITLTGTGTKTVDNSGTLSGNPYGIGTFPGSSGHADITNNTGAAISGLSIGIFVGSGYTSTIGNAGTISAAQTRTSAAVFGVVLADGGESSVSNTGSISAMAEGSEGPAAAGGIIVGGLTAGGSIDNSGTVSGTAISNTGGSATAAGIIVFGDIGEGSIDNGGTIEASADAAGGGANAGGIVVAGSMSSGSIDNSGTITAAAFSSESFFDVIAAGIYVQSGVLAGASIDNGGTIDVSATGAGDISAYGIWVESFTSLALAGSISNDGTILVEVTNDGNDFAEANGIEVHGDMGEGATVTNSGDISATATGDNAQAKGIDLQGDLLSGAAITNTSTGTITATATGNDVEVTGIDMDSSIFLGATLTNDGTIIAVGTATTDTAVVHAIEVNDDLAGTLTNNGAIEASASADFFAEAIGILIDDDIAESGVLTNAGSITVNGTGDFVTANGIRVDDSLFGELTITDTGTVDVTASGGDGAEAWGVVVESTFGEGAALTNDGSISVSAAASNSSWVTAGGIGAFYYMDGEITNNGTIDVSANQGGDGGEAYAVGIYTSWTISSSGEVTNDGTINVTATASGSEGWASATGIFLGFDPVYGSIVNSGTINVLVDASESFAVGIYANNVQAGASVTNSGTINVEGANSVVYGTVGMYANFLSPNATFANSGTVSANSPFGPGTGIAVVVNSGGSEGVPAVVDNSGNLYGHVLLYGNTSLNNTGLLSIPINRPFAPNNSYISGDYTQSGEGVLEFGAYSLDQYGQLVVNGTADFSASGALAVNVSPNDMLVSSGILDNVVSAGTLISPAGGYSVTDNSALWRFTASDDGEGGIDIHVDGDILVAEAVEENGPAWALPAAGVIDSIIQGGEAGGDMATVIANLGSLPQSEQLAGAAAQLVPVMVTRGIEAANLAISGLSSVVAARMDSRRLGVVDDASHDQNLWVRMYGTSGEQDDVGEYPEYETESYGLVVGYDRMTDSGWNVGGAVGYSAPEINSDSTLIDDRIESDVFHAALYGYRDIGGAYVDVMAMLGTSENDSRRHIVFADLDRVAAGDYSSFYGRIAGELGQAFAMDGVTFTPSVSAAYTRVEDESYTESGAGDLNLRVEDTQAESLILGIDAELAMAVGDSGVITGHVGYAYDTMTDRTTLSSAFVGGGPVFNTPGVEADENIIRAGVGAEFEMGNGGQVHIHYEYEDRDSFTNNLVMATVRIPI